MIPSNPEAEESLLGAMLMSSDAVDVGLEMVHAEDFHSPAYGAIHAAICNLHNRGDAVDTFTVTEEWARFDPQGADRAKTLELAANVPSMRNVATYAAVVTRNADSRRAMGLCADAVKAFGDLADPYETVDSLTAELANIDAPIDQSRQEAITIDQVIETAEEVSPWVVPGLLRQDFRVLLVAGEGQGKSVVLRQIAMLAAQGIHPLKFGRIKPIRSLIIDLENPAAAIAETGFLMAQRLRLVVGSEYDSTRCRIFRRPGGIDPRTRHGRGEIEREIMLQRPDLVCLGPAYKMLHRRAGKGGTESYEEATDPVLAILDDLRTRYHFALMIEHHAPQGYAGARDLRPYGSQRWLAWPEIGLSLRQEKSIPNTWNLERHRGDRLVCDWPDEMKHGTTWPWEGRWRTRQEF